MRPPAPDDFVEAVWAAITRQHGPVGEPARRGWGPTVARYHAAGMTPAQAATATEDGLVAAGEQFRAGLRAFQDLRATIETLDEGVDHAPRPDAVVERLLEAKLAMARLYHHLAGLADRADVPDVAPQEETARHLEESTRELERWRATGGGQTG